MCHIRNSDGSVVVGCQAVYLTWFSLNNASSASFITALFSVADACFMVLFRRLAGFLGAETTE